MDVFSETFVNTLDITEFVGGFNLEKPYENPCIGQIKNNMLRILVNEAAQTANSNWKYTCVYDDFKKRCTKDNNQKYTREQLMQPIEYIVNAFKMLIDKNATEWDGDTVNHTERDKLVYKTCSSMCNEMCPKTCVGMCPKTCSTFYPELCPNSYPHYNLAETCEKVELIYDHRYKDQNRDYRPDAFERSLLQAPGLKPAIELKHDKIPHSYVKHPFNYNVTYKSLLEKSLMDIKSLLQAASRHTEHTIYLIFHEKCVQLYYVILEHIQLMTHTYKDIAEKGSMLKNRINKEYLVSNFPGVSADILNIFEDNFSTNEDGVSLENIKKLKEHEQVVNKLFCESVVCGYVYDKFILKKIQNAEDQQRKIYSKAMCSIIVYGCMKEKTLRLENNNICESIRTKIKSLETKPYEIVGEILNNILLETLNTDIGVAKLTKTHIMWKDSSECFSFIIINVTNQINSKKMLAQLIDKSNKMITTDLMYTDVIVRISNLKNEIKQSKDYLVVLFSHLIVLTRQEIQKIKQ